MVNVCEVCGIEFETVKPARTCSAKCRVTLSRSGVTRSPNVTLAEVPVTRDVTLEFRIIRNKDDDKPNPVRTAVYWYDVPLSAVPKLKKGWPEMPDYMNGRQYFLWWKNEFKTNQDPKKGELGQPIIHNPFPDRDKIEYVKAGEGSRYWGTV